MTLLSALRTALPACLLLLAPISPVAARPDHHHHGPGCLDPSHDEGGRGDAQAKKADGKGLPLEPAGTIPMRLREGSWMSLDVSPDGETVAFDLLGDIWSVPLAGGDATRLTKGLAFDSQPRYSPDGTRLVFVSDRSGEENLWVLTLGEEEPEQVTKGEAGGYQSPEWTPDGSYLVASRGGLIGPVAKPWLFHVDGGSGIQLVKEPDDLRLTGAAFGDDENVIWFARRKGRWNYDAQFPQYQLVTYDRREGRLVQQTGRFGSAFRPTLSPDGRWLVYGTRHDEGTGLLLRDLRSGDERWLAWPAQHDEQEARASRDVLPGMSFTPDSKELVASAHGRIWRFPVAGGDPVEVPFLCDFELEVGPTLDAEFAVDDSETFPARQVRDVAPSPDGSRVAFVALDRIWLMDWPDGEPRRLTRQEQHSEHQPAWSPDGRKIAYASWSEAGGHLQVASSRPGSRPRALTTVTGLYFEPAWSPDGSRLVARRTDARLLREAAGPAWSSWGLADLVEIPARGGEPRVIAPSEGRGGPHFVKDDPDRIWLSHEDKGLISIRWDGTDERVHLKVAGGQDRRRDKPLKADSLRVSPDGRRVLAEVVNELYVTELPLTAEPAEIKVANPDSAAVPVRKLTKVGGQFPTWSADGAAAWWSVGPVLFRHDFAAAEAAEAEAEARKQAEEKAREEAGEDESADDHEEDGADDEKKKEEPAYEPREVRVRIDVKRDLPKGDLLLSGARVITMAGDEIIENADLLISGHRIAAVGPRGSFEVPAGARRLDLSGRTIVPGFVDTHAHVWPSWGIHRPEAWAYLANLAYGVTTTRDPQTATTDVLSYFDLVEAGRMVGPRLYSTGPGVFWSENVKDQDHADDVVRRYAEYYGVKSIKMYVSGTRKQRQWILEACRKQGLRPTTEGALDLKLNLTQILDGYPGHEHNFPNFPLFDDVVRLVVERGTQYTPTLLVTYGGPAAENHWFTHENVHDDPKLRRFAPHSLVDGKSLQSPWFHPIREVFDDHAVFVKDLVEAGGNVGVGSHGQLQGLGYHWELWSMASGGLSNHDALRAATILGAEGLGFGSDLGSIERGKIADLLVLEATPLEDLRNTNTLEMVMKGGRLRDADTLDELWPEERPFELRNWREPEPKPWRVP